MSWLFISAIFLLLAIPSRFCYLCGLEELKLADTGRMTQFRYRIGKSALWSFLGMIYVLFLYFAWSNRVDYPIFMLPAVASLVPPFLVWSVGLVIGGLGAGSDLIVMCIKQGSQFLKK